MRNPSRALLLLAAAALLVVPVDVEAQSPLDDPELQEWQVPYERTRPRDPAVAPRYRSGK